MPPRSDHADRLRWATDRLRATGHRTTRPRGLVLGVLARAEGHLTAETLHARAGGVDLSTVYRTLTTLERVHLVHTVVVGGRLTYGLADHPLAHAVCEGCARVTALRGPEWRDLPAVAEAGLEGFEPTSVIVRGRCGSCSGQRV